MNTQDIIDERRKERFLDEADYLWTANKRKDVYILLLVILALGLGAMLIHVAKSKANQAPIIVAIDQQGFDHILSNGTHKLDLKDSVFLKALEGSIDRWAEANYRRDPVTYDHDWFLAQQFMTDRMVKDEEVRYNSFGSRRIAYTKLPPCSIRVLSFVSTEEDRFATPFTARLRITKSPENSPVETWDLVVLFIYAPQKATRFNPLGIFIDKVTETQEAQ